MAACPCIGRFRIGSVALYWLHSQLLGFGKVQSIQMKPVYYYSMNESVFCAASSTRCILFFCGADLLRTLKKPSSEGVCLAENLLDLQCMGGVIQY